MQFSLTTEQADLQRTLADFFAQRAPLADSVLAADADRLFDPRVWAAMAAELGLAGVDVPERLGGADLSAVELSLVFQQAGRELYPGPLMASSGLGLSLLLAAPEPTVDAEALISAVAEGRVVAAAVTDEAGPWLADLISTAAWRQGDGWRLSGTKRRVLDAGSAQTLLVAARADDGDLALFAVARDAVAVESESSIDPLRTTGVVRLEDAPATLLASGLDGWLEPARLRADVVIASESLGAAGRVLDLAVEHATNRRQFGQPVGAFQGVKHRLADVLVDLELATSAVYLAACHLSVGDLDQARASAPMARSAADDALAAAAAASVQAHGGIGFTWENASHFFVKRARANRELLGSPGARLDAVWDHGQALAATS